MKRIIALLLVAFLLTGCQLTEENIRAEIITKIDEHVKNTEFPKNNTYRQSYSYYLPISASIEEQFKSNDIIKVNQAKLYFFVDLYSYKNSLDINYRLNLDPLYQKEVSLNNRVFTLTVYQNKTEYIVFASNNFSRVSANTTIGYLPDIIETMITLMSTIEVDDDVVLSAEVEVENPIVESIDIFKSKVEEDNVIKYQEEETE